MKHANRLFSGLLSLALALPAPVLAQTADCVDAEALASDVALVFSDWKKLIIEPKFGPSDCNKADGFTVSAANEILDKALQIEQELRKNQEGELKLDTVDRIVMNFSNTKMVNKKWYNPFDNNNMDLLRSETAKEFIQISATLSESSDILTNKDFENIYFDPNLMIGGDILVLDQAIQVNPKAVWLSVKAVDEEFLEFSSTPARVLTAGGIYAIGALGAGIVGFAMVPNF